MFFLIENTYLPLALALDFLEIEFNSQALVQERPAVVRPNDENFKILRFWCDFDVFGKIRTKISSNFLQPNLTPVHHDFVVRHDVFFGRFDEPKPTSA